MIEQFLYVMEFIKEHWPIIAAFGLTISGITFWLVGLYRIGLLKLQIRKLKTEIEQNKQSPIPIATLEEIVEYSKSNPDTNKVKQLLIKMSNIDYESQGLYKIPDELVSKYADSLSVVLDKPFKPFDLTENPIWEPLAMAILGGLIGMIVVKLYLPIFEYISKF